MTISAEAQNVLNKVNYDRISGVLTSPFFGQPIRARDGRQVSYRRGSTSEYRAVQALAHKVFCG
jgi:hypothetical protein